MLISCAAPLSPSGISLNSAAPFSLDRCRRRQQTHMHETASMGIGGSTNTGPTSVQTGRLLGHFAVIRREARDLAGSSARHLRNLCPACCAFFLSLDCRAQNCPVQALRAAAETDEVATAQAFMDAVNVT